MSADTLEPTTDIVPRERGHDDDRLAHIVNRDELARYRREGGTVTALCGKRWHPRRVSPRDVPLCVVCQSVARRSYPWAPGGS